MYKSLAALFLAGSALALPTATVRDATADTYPTCQSRSTSVTAWTVENFDYHASYVFSTPAHQNSWGYVNFNLTNPAVDYKATCSASSDQLSDFFYGNFIYKCTVPVQADQATFTFNRPTGDLRINQTWNCADEGSRFTAQGGVKLDLNCTQTVWTNPNWQPGSGLYSTRTVTCAKVTVPAPIESISAVL